MFNKIAIIGCGLIGSSILRSIKEYKIAKKVNIFDKSKDVFTFLKKENLIEGTNDINQSVRDADLIVIATPLGAYKEILLSIKDDLKKNIILTDTGSAKKEINKIIENLNLKEISWIASHPIAGTEESGPQAGFHKLFKDRYCIISPSQEAKKEDVEKLKKFWEKIGCKVKTMSFEEHDHILSLTSHLPHAIAYNLVRTAISKEDQFKKEIIQYSAGGLRDFTRIASSDPTMWKDIFKDNSENILKALDNFSNNLVELKEAIKEKNESKLIQIFSKTKNVRKEIIEAGQDTNKPDFGRKKD
ncbi:MAG: prephenate dehydrogenase [Pelagibacteraceae bacterium]